MAAVGPYQRDVSSLGLCCVALTCWGGMREGSGEGRTIDSSCTAQRRVRSDHSTGAIVRGGVRGAPVAGTCLDGGLQEP